VDVDHVPSQPSAPESIDVIIPARPEYVAVVRLAAAGVAGRTALSYDDIEDIKVAVGEACNAAIRAESRQVHVRFVVASDRLEIVVTHQPGPPVAPDDPAELGLVLMKCLMDGVEITGDGTQSTTVMRKRFP
jgi:serine/threonine-protein kinase RsbW